MVVVSDTTPLIALMKAAQLELLQKLFGRILVPQAVFRELTRINRSHKSHYIFLRKIDVFLRALFC